MNIPDAKEKWTGRVNSVTLGAMPVQGGTRGRTVTIGGHSGIPFLSFDGKTPHPAAIALDVLDVAPTDWPETSFTSASREYTIGSGTSSATTGTSRSARPRSSNVTVFSTRLFSDDSRSSV